MKRAVLLLSLLAAAVPALIISCVHKPFVPPAPVPQGGFPREIANILVAKCAVSGCHNAASYGNAGGLLLDTWEHLFLGGESGSVIIPYSPQFSPLLYFVNTDSTQGLVALPRMPMATSSAGTPPLTAAEYQTLTNWIASGAPDKDGNVAFASNATGRQKIYIAQGQSDMMAVVDAESHLVMRYAPLGSTASKIEGPHCVRTNSDGSYAYVSFLSSDYIQKMDTRTDQVVASANVGNLALNYSWSIVYVAPADTAIVTSSFNGDGIVAYAGTSGMTLGKRFGGGGSNVLAYPHGIESNLAFDTLFVTAQYGNTVYKITSNPTRIKSLSIDSESPVASTSTTTINRNPHEIQMSPDHSRYFLSCQGSNEIRVMNAHNDTLIAAIPVGTYPQDISMSKVYPYIFVSCREDASSNAGMKGSVYAINYNTLEKIRIDGDFFQPHGIAVDDRNGLLYVVSLNEDGPPSHHPVVASTRAGWYSIIDMRTMRPYNDKRYQLLAYPYSATARFR